MMMMVVVAVFLGGNHAKMLSLIEEILFDRVK
jgi:hypothetical protein